MLFARCSQFYVFLRISMFHSIHRRLSTNFAQTKKSSVGIKWEIIIKSLPATWNVNACESDGRGMKERVSHKIKRFFWNRKNTTAQCTYTCAMNPRFATNCIQMLHKFANSIWIDLFVAHESESESNQHNNVIAINVCWCDLDRTIDQPMISPEIVTPNRKWLWQRRSLLSVRFVFTFPQTLILYEVEVFGIYCCLL